MSYVITFDIWASLYYELICILNFDLWITGFHMFVSLYTISYHKMVSLRIAFHNHFNAHILHLWHIIFTCDIWKSIIWASSINFLSIDAASPNVFLRLLINVWECFEYTINFWLSNFNHIYLNFWKTKLYFQSHLLNLTILLNIICNICIIPED